MTTKDIECFYAIEDRLADKLTADSICTRSRELIEGIRRSLIGRPMDITKAKILTLELRQLNRLSTFKIHQSYKKILTLQEQADMMYMEMSNKSYEVWNMRRLINEYMEYKSEDLLLNLPSKDEVHATASERLEINVEHMTDPHQMRLVQLKLELHNREKMADIVLQLRNIKYTLDNDFAKNKHRLEQVPYAIREVRRSLKRLANILGI